MKIKPANELHAHCLQNAIDALIIARAQLHVAQCPKALDAVRRALKSAEGAQRHMLRRLMPRSAEGEPLRREHFAHEDEPKGKPFEAERLGEL